MRWPLMWKSTHEEIVEEKELKIYSLENTLFLRSQKFSITEKEAESLREERNARGDHENILRL